MKNRMIGAALAVTLLSAFSAQAEIREFTDTVRVVMGSRESQDEVRVYATQEAKRRVLDKVGVYLSGSTEIVRKVEEATYLPRRHEGDTNKNFESSWFDSSSVLQTIQTLTVGVVQTEVVSEEWKSEGGSFVLTLVCRVKVDPEDALARLTELLKDKQKVEDYQKVQEEVERLRGDLAQLRLDLESAKTEKEKVAVKEEVQEKINGLGANDWLEKSLVATELDEKIACANFAIQLNPNLSRPYNIRGVVFDEKGDFGKAIIEYSQALQIDPYEKKYYNNRGCAYNRKGDYERAIADFDRAIALDPNDAQSYYCRGLSFASKNEYDRSLIDLNHALQISPNYADAIYFRGYLYQLRGEINQARNDFEKAVELGNQYAKDRLKELK